MFRPERVAHSVLTARIILNLRELGSRQQQHLGWSTFSATVRDAETRIGDDDVEFAHPDTENSENDGTITVVESGVSA